MAPAMMMKSAGNGGRAGGHVRSASVPTQRNPLLTHVDDQLRALRSWTSDPGQNPLALAHVRALLCVLDELLEHSYLPLALAPADALLDGFLALADAYGCFLAALLALRGHAAELRAAVRRRDPAKLASAARAQRRASKDLAGLAAAVAKCVPVPVHTSSSSASSCLDVARTVAKAVGDTAAASASVFLQVAALADAAAATALASSSATSPKPRLALVSGKKPAAAGEDTHRDAAARLLELEECVGELESESEKVFRSLVRTRVSLLNIHTPAI
ncbi:hypothetical protein CFC21_100672 [Triticum aestivum]|uniref:Uncharacterized protein n=3 Tax=Triticum TaxID=4564 RepID=A0A9R0ZPF7_TRITD|nr:hypothetical protein CFC21_100672 [Triticum aestivum]VAI81679.1 unnamed protein product [Triticum turgidum subsp. durum]